VKRSRVEATPATPVRATLCRLVDEWLDRAPSTLADPVGDLVLHLERWLTAGCPLDDDPAPL
jgi:hypothetical protein